MELVTYIIILSVNWTGTITTKYVRLFRTYNALFFLERRNIAVVMVTATEVYHSSVMDGSSYEPACVHLRSEVPA